MPYKPRLLYAMQTPTFKAYEPFLWGMGVDHLSIHSCSCTYSCQQPSLSNGHEGNHHHSSLFTLPSLRFPGLTMQSVPPKLDLESSLISQVLECRKWGFKRWGFKQIPGYLRKKAFLLRFLDFPGALRPLRKRAKKAGKGRKRPISADFQDGRPDTP